MSSPQLFSKDQDTFLSVNDSLKFIHSIVINRLSNVNKWVEEKKLQKGVGRKYCSRGEVKSHKGVTEFTVQGGYRVYRTKGSYRT